MTDTETQQGSTAPELNATTILSEHDEREAVYRHVFMGQTQRTIGDLLGVSSSTISKVIVTYKHSSGTALELSILDQFTDEDDYRDPGDREFLTETGDDEPTVMTDGGSDIQTFTPDEFEAFADTLWDFHQKPQMQNWRNHIPDGHTEAELADIEARTDDWRNSRMDSRDDHVTDDEYDLLSDARYQAFKADDYTDDEQEAEEEAMRIFTRAKNHATTIAIMTRQTAGMKFYADGESAENFGKLPEFDTIWDVDIARETEKSFGVKRALARKQWNEELYFRNEFEKGRDDSLLWLPKSGTIALRVEEPEPTDAIIRNADGSETTGRASTADIAFTHIEYGRYDRLHFDSEFSAKDHISPNATDGLDRDIFHPQWDGDQWSIDAAKAQLAIQHFTDAGLSVGIPAGLLEADFFDAEAN